MAVVAWRFVWRDGDRVPVMSNGSGRVVVVVGVVMVVAMLECYCHAVVMVAARWVEWAAAMATVRWRGRLWDARQRGACGDEGKVRFGVAAR
jgi:hypothetical protein